MGYVTFCYDTLMLYLRQEQESNVLYRIRIKYQKVENGKTLEKYIFIFYFFAFSSKFYFIYVQLISTQTHWHTTNISTIFPIEKIYKTFICSSSFSSYLTKVMVPNRWSWWAQDRTPEVVGATAETYGEGGGKQKGKKGGKEMWVEYILFRHSTTHQRGEGVYNNGIYIFSAQSYWRI